MGCLDDRMYYHNVLIGYVDRGVYQSNKLTGCVD